jgi:hypothetical protein
MITKKILKTKEETIYVAKDGKEFYTEEQAISWEKLLDEKEEARKILRLEKFGSRKDCVTAYRIFASKNEKDYIYRLFAKFEVIIGNILSENKEYFIVEEYDNPNEDNYSYYCNLIRLDSFLEEELSLIRSDIYRFNRMSAHQNGDGLTLSCKYME